MQAATQPQLIYDGDCAFCTRVARWAADRLGPDAEVVAWQRADLAKVGLTAVECAAAVQWVDRSGNVGAGHVAVARALVAMGGPWRVVGVVLGLPVVSALAAVLYRLVARNRHRLPGGTDACRL